jgi:hypothetical protein
VTITAELARNHQGAELDCDLPPGSRRARIGIDD